MLINQSVGQFMDKNSLVIDSVSEDDTKRWFNSWVTVVIKGLAEGVFDESIGFFFNNKLIQKRTGQGSKKPFYHFNSLALFLEELFTEYLELKQLTINPETCLDEMDIAIDGLRRNKDMKSALDKLDNSYLVFCQQTIQNSIKSVDQHNEETAFKAAFAAFWETYQFGLFEDKQQKIQDVIAQSAIQEGSSLHFKQNNTKLMQSYFLQWIQENKLLAYPVTEVNLSLVTQVITHLAPDLETHAPLNQSFYASLRQLVLTQKNTQNKQLILTVNDETASQGINLVIDLIARHIFQQILIKNAADVVFSYDEKQGLLVNQHFLDEKQTEQVQLFIALKEYDKTPSLNYNFYPFMNPLDEVNSRVRDLARQATAHQGSVFCFDERVHFSQFGGAGIKYYLAALEQKFTQELRQNKLNKGYSFFLPNTASRVAHKLTAGVIEGFNEFMTNWFSGKENYFFCHALSINITNLDEHELKQMIAPLISLIERVDRAGVAQLTLHLSSLNAEQIAWLNTALQSVKHTRVRFAGLPTAEIALELEAVNELALQHAVNYSAGEAIPSKTVAEHAPLFTQAKINALLEQDIVLPKMVGKVGIQHKYQYEHEAQQQTEVKVMQSWQIDQRQEVKHESSHKSGFFADDKNTLVSWHDINAALDTQHPGHELAKNKLGEEILHYRFKDRNLLDLWERLTGNIGLSKQNVVPDEADSTAKILQFYSPYVPKQISVKTLLTIVRHPHLFQDGLSLAHLPASIYFGDGGQSVLYTNDSRPDEQVSPLALKITQVPKPDLPIARYYSLMCSAHLPSSLFLQTLSEGVGTYRAWHYWRRGFVALNYLNEEGIRAVHAVLVNLLNNKDEVAICDAIDYLIQTLNYYHYRKSTNQLTQVAASQALFEEQERAAEAEGKENALSSTLISTLSADLRKKLHQDVTDILSQADYTEGASSQGEKNCRSLILAVLASYPEQGITFVLDQPTWIRILDKLGFANEKRLLELMLSNHGSTVCVLLHALADLLHVWGKVGLTDFADVFLKPSLNFANLSDPTQQTAFRQLLQLSQVEYHWWQQLTQQHVAQSGYSDFASLMQAFQNFLAQLHELHLDDLLSMPCPLDGIVNLPVDLDRMISVLKLVKNPREQWNNLSKLDWRADGVIKAVQEKSFHFVSADMQLNLAYEQKFHAAIQKYKLSHYYRQYEDYDGGLINNFVCQHNEEIAAARPETLQALFELSLICFLRFIGSEKYVAPLNVYQQLLAALQVPENYTVIERIMGLSYFNDVLQTAPIPKQGANPLILSQILMIIAYTMTGSRGLDRMPQQEKLRVAALNEFLVAAYECALERSSCNELQVKYDKINAVSYYDLMGILGSCIELAQKEKYTRDEQAIRLDLRELTLILQMIKNADADYRSLLQPEKLFNYQIENVWRSEQIWGRIDNQLLFTKQLLGEYKQYFIDALQRMAKYNTNSNFVLFLLYSLNLKHYGFSFENKGRLIRLTSLLALNYDTYLSAVPQYVAWLNQLQTIQKLAGSGELDKLLTALSCLVPQISLEKLVQLGEHCITSLQKGQSLDMSLLLSSYFSECHPDEDLSDIRDPDFYQSAVLLEQKFPELGEHYQLIKTVLLHRHPVAFGDDKHSAWNQFLYLLQEVKSTTEKQLILQTVHDYSHQLDLNTLNQWLVALLMPVKEKPHFQREYFDLFSLQLLNHPMKQDYIQLVHTWFNQLSEQPAAHYSGFVRILNQIAALNLPTDCLKNFAQTMRDMSLLYYSTQPDWFADMEQLIKVWQEKKLPVDALNQVFLSLQYLHKIAGGKNTSQALLRQLLPMWMANIQNTFDLTVTFAAQWDDKNPNKIFSYMLILAQVKQIDLQNVYDFLVRLNDDDLQKLSACYETQPVPDTSLIAQLLSKNINVAQFITQHTSDPHHERDDLKLNQQFNDDLLWPYLDRVKNLFPDIKEDEGFTQLFPAQLKFMNQIGREEIRYLSLHELGQRLHDCREILAKTTNRDEKMVAYLTALSIIRETIYKTSQPPAILWLSPIQILGVLSFLNNLLNKELPAEISALFLQMATGEGKSLLAASIGLLSWLNGKPVAIVTHRASLALRDAKVFEKLFAALNIESRQLTADNYRWQLIWKTLFKEDKPEFSGVYYVDFNDLALIRQQKLLETGEALNEMSFVVDEADEIILHNLTDNNLTKTIGNEKTHPYAWVFEALAAYFDKYNPKRDVRIHLADVVSYLQIYSPLGIGASQKVEFLLALPDYVRAIWQAKTLKEREDFVAKPTGSNDDKNEYYAAVLINDKHMPTNVTFNGLVQQALHGRLNYEAKQKQLLRHYSVAPETQLFSTMSPDAVFAWMKSCGLFTALSATVGSEAEMREMKLNLGFDFTKLPKTQSKTRVDYPVRFHNNEAEQFQAIEKICAHHTGKKTQLKSRAILIVVENIAFAETLGKYLKKQSGHFNISYLHAGLKDISDETLSKLEQQSGRAGNILIAVSGLISRGFDIKLTDASQLVVITTYLKNWVDEIQVKGRGGRVNPLTGKRDKGKFFAAYNLALESARYPGFVNPTEDILFNPEGYKKRQYFAHYRQESAQRLHRQLVGITKNAIQADFFHLWSTLFKEESVTKTMRDQVMALFTESLKKITAVVPVDDFSMTSNKTTALHQYNETLLAFYKEALIGIEMILNQALLGEQQERLSALLLEIESQQQYLRSKREQVLGTGPDKPKAMVYERWKDGVQFNAYLDAGNQSYVNYWRHVYKSWWLSAEDKSDIKAQKTNLENALSVKQAKKSDFLFQLQQRMAIGLEKENPARYLSIYHQKNAQSKTSLELVQVQDEIPAQSMITKQLSEMQTLSFIHDPLGGKTCQIRMCGNEMALFARLQKAVQEAYQECKISHKLKFQIMPYRHKKTTCYQLTLDFSDHFFDEVNRVDLLSHIAKHFNTDLRALFAKPSIPSLAAMKSSYAHLTALIHHPKTVLASDLVAQFKQFKIKDDVSRPQYYELLFRPVISWLTQVDKRLPAGLRNYARALVNCDKPLEYYNLSGKKCTTYPAAFENQLVLCENHKKRTVLICLHNRIKALMESPLKGRFLLKQQCECLMNLSMQIVNSSTANTVQVIYDKWQEGRLLYQQKTLTTKQLLGLRDKQGSNMLFNRVESPDLSDLCTKIEKISQEKSIKEDLSTTLII